MRPITQAGRLAHGDWQRPTEPFCDAEQAWFWTMGALRARHDGASGGRSSVPRPCDPDDIIRCLDQLYRHRRIDLAHARTLRLWGERQMSPDGRAGRDSVLWREAMERLAEPLRNKGIVAGARKFRDIGKKSLTSITSPA